MQQERAAQQQMMKLITSGNFEQAQASAILAQESQTHLRLGMAHAQIASQIFQTVLTADQRSQVTAMIAQHQLRMEQRTQEKGESAPTSE